MEGNYDGPAAWHNVLWQNLFQGMCQMIKFLVDCDPQRLKRTRRRITMWLTCRAGHRPANNLRNFSGTLRQARSPGCHNRAGNPRGEPFLSQRLKQFRQFVPVQPLQQCRGRLSGAGVKSQIKWPLSMKAESACAVVELIRTQPQVEQYPIDAAQPFLLQNLRQLLITGVMQMSRSRRQDPAGMGQHHRVAVEANQQPFRANHFENV